MAFFKRRLRGLQRLCRVRLFLLPLQRFCLGRLGRLLRLGERLLALLQLSALRSQRGVELFRCVLELTMLDLQLLQSLGALHELFLKRLLRRRCLALCLLKGCVRLLQTVGSFRVPLLPLLHFQARRLGRLLRLCKGLLALLEVLMLSVEGRFELLDSVLELAQLGLPLSELLLSILEVLRGCGVLRLELFEGLGALRQLFLERLLGSHRVVFCLLKGCVRFAEASGSFRMALLPLLHFRMGHLQLLLEGCLGLLCFCKSRTCPFNILAQGFVLRPADIHKLL
jgi:hypothetical protein